ncbi:MAG: hypothetical protein NTW14_10040 [bacterium]|nr:hypothetical protein [bacterium]
MTSRRLVLFYLPLLWAAAGWFTISVAAPWETLPPDHWAYNEIRWLQTAGYLQELDPGQRPYTRGQVARALARNATPAERVVLERLKLLADEFRPEMTSVRGRQGWRTFAGGRVSAGVEDVHGVDSRAAGYVVLDLGTGNKRFGVYSAIRVDRDLAENPAYTDKIWHHTAGFTEQAYLVFTGARDRWTLKLGRDHISWGPGEDHLLLNDAPRGMDQISFRIGWRWGSFTALIGQLDDYTDSSGVRTSRFLSGHRFEFQPVDWMRVGISETLLFTGGVRFGSMNPLLPFYGELANENSEGNGMISLDVNAFPCPGVQAYGELLLDDIQFENKKPQDLEPTEWGWLIGSRWCGFEGLLGLSADYSGITNRTYNAPDEKYRYLSRGLPLGSELGNDGDRLKLQATCWPIARVRLDGYWSLRRQGEGRVSSPFDSSYVNFTVAQGYSEPFPTGTIEKTNALGFGFSALLLPYLQAEGVIEYDWIKNAGNSSANNDEGARWRISLNVRLDHLYNHP